MTRVILIVLTLLLFACQEKLRHNDYSFNDIQVKIDSRIAKQKESEIVATLEYHLSKEGWIQIPNLKEITIDSVLYSYLLTLNTPDSIDPNKLHLVKAYTELLSNETLDKKPVHIYISSTGQYIEFDSTILKEKTDIFQFGRLKVETRDVGNYLQSRITKILEKSLRQVTFDGPLRVILKADSSAYSVDFILDPKKHNAVQFRDSIGAINPYHKFLILDNDELFVNFKDSTGRVLTGSVHFQ